MRVDWFRTITDLQQAGVPLRLQAAHADVVVAAVYAWKAGSEPRYCSGSRLLDLYVQTMHQAPPFQATSRTT